MCLAWFQHWNGSIAPPQSIAHSPVVYVSLTEARVNRSRARCMYV